jgi:hypothetical protein
LYLMLQLQQALLPCALCLPAAAELLAADAAWLLLLQQLLLHPAHVVLQLG